MVMVVVMGAMVRWTTLCDVVVVAVRAVMVWVVAMTRMVMGCCNGVIRGRVMNPMIVAF